MKKLFLLVAIAATFTFAACTNAKTTGEAEVTTEEVDVAIEADTTIVIIDENEVAQVEEVVE